MLDWIMWRWTAQCLGFAVCCQVRSVCSRRLGLHCAEVQLIQPTTCFRPCVTDSGARVSVTYGSFNSSSSLLLCFPPCIFIFHGPEGKCHLQSCRMVDWWHPGEISRRQQLVFVALRWHSQFMGFFTFLIWLHRHRSYKGINGIGYIGYILGNENSCWGSQNYSMTSEWGLWSQCSPRISLYMHYGSWFILFLQGNKYVLSLLFLTLDPKLIYFLWLFLKRTVVNPM